MNRLINIQKNLKAPKGQYNSFGKYKYRSCEDILESIKPLLSDAGLALIISDEIVQINQRYYVKATATLFDTDGKQIVSTSALAREEEAKKGMDGSQVTGASSSYARKYALNGLFAIDDTKDSDSTNTHDDKPQAKKPVKQESKEKQIDADFDIIQGITTFDDMPNLTKYFDENKNKVKDFEAFKTACTRRKEYIQSKGA